MTEHYETGHATDYPDAPDARVCTCTLGLDHDRRGCGIPDDPPTILGQPAATCPTCSAPADPPRPAPW